MQRCDQVFYACFCCQESCVILCCMLSWFIWRTCTCTASSNMDRKSLIRKGDALVDTLFKKPKKVLSTADLFQSMLYCRPQKATTVIDAVQHC